MKKQTLSIIKIGGQVINDPNRLHQFLTGFSKIEGHKILVHGGGRKATELGRSLGIEAKMILGRRVTDNATLDIVTMVYAGLINKNVVAQLQSLGVQALGLSGADLNTIQSHKRIVKDIDYGFAGDIDQVNSKAIEQLLLIGAVPVFCPITHDKKAQLLNTNADTIAATLAAAMTDSHDVNLYFCFEKKGVLIDPNDDNSVISKLNLIDYQAFKKSEVISGGMIPKIDNAFMALNHQVKQVFICSPEAIIQQSMKNATCICH